MNKNTSIILFTIIFSSLISSSEIDRSYYKTDEEIDLFYGDAAESRGSASQHRSLETIKSQVAYFDRTKPEDGIPMLAENLRKLAMTNVYQIPERFEVYDLVQSTLLSTPGHARYYADEIERRIANLKYPDDDVRERKWYLQQTLVHLPSPETIQVLGHYLSDERFKMDPTRNNSGATGQSCYMAATALRRIGLRESEEYIRTQGSILTSSLDLASCRRWWEEVKSGQRTFSFKGQAVEYRFKPDGTWETLPIANPPDDGPGSVVPDEPSTPATPSIVDPPPQSIIAEAMSKPWIWVSILAFGLVVVFGWLAHRRKKTADCA